MRRARLVPMVAALRASAAVVVARGKPVICLAHVTNAMGRDEGDFEKGEADGTAEVLRILAVLSRALAGTANAPEG
jgi:hypothetical protein